MKHLEAEVSAWMVHALARADLLQSEEKPVKLRRKPAKAEIIGLARKRDVERELEQPEIDSQRQKRVDDILANNPAAKLAWEAGFFNGTPKDYPNPKRERPIMHGSALPDSAEKPYAEFARKDEEFLASGRVWHMTPRNDIWAHMKVDFDVEVVADIDAPLGEIHVIGLTGRTFHKKHDTPTNGNSYSAEVRQLQDERMKKAHARTLAQKWSKIRPKMRMITIPDYLQDASADVKFDYIRSYLRQR